MKKDHFPPDEINERHGPKGDVKVPKEKESTGINLLFFYISFLFKEYFGLKIEHSS